MTRSATEVMERVLVAAVLDALAALKAASGGMPNALLRDLQAIHANTTFADLPKEVQATVQASVRAAFRELQKEGYAVGPASAMPAISLQRPRTCRESASNKLLPLLAAQHRSRDVFREWTPNP